MWMWSSGPFEFSQRIKAASVLYFFTFFLRILFDPCLFVFDVREFTY